MSNIFNRAVAKKAPPRDTLAIAFFESALLSGSDALTFPPQRGIVQTLWK